SLMSHPVLHPVLGMEEEQVPITPQMIAAPIAMENHSIGPDCASHWRNSGGNSGIAKSSAMRASMKMRQHIVPIGIMSFIASLPSIRSRPRGDPCGHVMPRGTRVVGVLAVWAGLPSLKTNRANPAIGRRESRRMVRVVFILFLLSPWM